MTMQTTANLTNSVRAQYIAKYLSGARKRRVYDQLAVPYTDFSDGIAMNQLMQSSSISIPFLSSMKPGTTAISETSDITPQTLADAVVSATWTSRGEALQWSEKLDIEAYTNLTAARYEKLGDNATETIENLAVDEALTGAWVERAAARASLDAGTSGNRASDSIFRKYHAKMLTLKIPGFINDAGDANTWAAIMHPYPFHDICESGNVNDIGLYQQAGIHLNFELGKIGPFRLVVTPFAKTFGGAGADNTTDVSTTLNGAVARLATTIVTAGDVSANIAKGELWTIGTEETGDTFYPTNERIKVVSASTVTLTIVGEGENGGLKYAHASGEAVRNADSVYPILFGGPQSMVKVFATDIGEYGETLPPEKTGLLKQFTSIGWKFYGGYNLLTENRLLRYECSTSYEA
jgi:N4-gp56 family major capsid protein